MIGELRWLLFASNRLTRSLSRCPLLAGKNMFLRVPFFFPLCRVFFSFLHRLLLGYGIFAPLNRSFPLPFPPFQVPKGREGQALCHGLFLLALWELSTSPAPSHPEGPPSTSHPPVYRSFLECRG